MAELLISTEPDFGPLSVEVVAATGEPLTSRPVLLSSMQTSTIFYDLMPGPYAVVGTRPSGETLVKRVTLGPNNGVAKFESHASPQQESPSEAVVRGMVPFVLAEISEDPSASRLRTFNTRLFPSSAGRNLQTLLVPKISAELGLQETGRTRGLDRGHFGEPVTEGKPAQLTFRQWRLVGNKWRDVPDAIRFNLEPAIAEVSVDSGHADQPRAFGLIDDNGFGPIVVSPSFGRGLRISFLADGLSAGYAAERVSNPSAVRVPVAAAVPNDPGLADLLSALAAPSMPDAQRLWQQDAEQHFGSTENALDMLLKKYDDPTAAVLGAHFLARFKPSLAPIRWLQNLSELLPHIADPLVLLATRLIAEGSTEERITSRQDIGAILLQASHRPCCLFGRTRAMLTQALRLYGPRTPETATDIESEAGQPRTSEFLDVAAEAGGLEAFWGSSPARPGRPPKKPKPQRQTTVIHLVQGAFIP